MPVIGERARLDHHAPAVLAGDQFAVFDQSAHRLHGAPQPVRHFRQKKHRVGAGQYRGVHGGSVRRAVWPLARGEAAEECRLSGRRQGRVAHANTAAARRDRKTSRDWVHGIDSSHRCASNNSARLPKRGDPWLLGGRGPTNRSSKPYACLRGSLRAPFSALISATSSRRGFRSLPAPGSNRRNTLSTSQGIPTVKKRALFETW